VWAHLPPSMLCRTTRCQERAGDEQRNQHHSPIERRYEMGAEHEQDGKAEHGQRGSMTIS
jgi:hypothetical protein